jgi:hypothetical protein
MIDDFRSWLLLASAAVPGLPVRALVEVDPAPWTRRGGVAGSSSSGSGRGWSFGSVRGEGVEWDLLGWLRAKERDRMRAR